MSNKLIYQLIAVVLLMVLSVAGFLYLTPLADGQGEASGHASTKASTNHADHAANAEQHKEKEDGHDKHNEPGHKGSEKTGHEEHQANAVHLTKDQLAKLDLKIDKAESGSASAVVEAPASVEFNGDRIARVGPLLESKVVKVVKDVGDKVKAGETVAILDSVKLGRVKASYLSAQARYQSVLAEYQRDKQLAEKQITSEAELITSRAAYLEARADKNALMEELRLYGLSQSAIDSIEAGSEQPFSRYLLSSPVDGVIQQRDLVPGETLSASDTPIHVVNTDSMWLMIDAYEADIPRLEPGQPVTLRLRALSDRTFEGTTEWVSRELDPKSRTVTIRALLQNPQHLLRAGQFGRARIHTGSKMEYALVPVDAVQNLEQENVVFVPGHEQGAFKAVHVKTGDESNGYVELRQGIEPGDQVVVRGAFDLKSALTASGRSAAHSH